MLKFLPKNFLARRKFFLFKKSLSSEITPFLIVIFSLFFAGIVTVVISPRNSPTLQPEKKTAAPNLLGEKDKTSKSSVDKVNGDLEINKRSNSGVKKELKTPLQNNERNNNTDLAPETLGATNQTQAVQTSQSPQNPDPLPPPSPPTIAQVGVTIITPSSTSNFTVELEEGFDICGVLVKAKNEGKISSLILDDSYLSTYKSLYVYEINGFANNWTFTVNGESPLGCSLYFPKKNDVIVWKFG